MTTYACDQDLDPAPVPVVDLADAMHMSLIALLCDADRQRKLGGRGRWDVTPSGEVVEHTDDPGQWQRAPYHRNRMPIVRADRRGGRVPRLYTRARRNPQKRAGEPLLRFNEWPSGFGPQVWRGTVVGSRTGYVSPRLSNLLTGQLTRHPRVLR